ncbi:MAG TPA: hypothetical protein VKI62_09240, partial [Bacteroidota bacterium]|nr:hypothetical protein [Bacteroidota bacterium]
MESYLRNLERPNDFLQALDIGTEITTMVIDTSMESFLRKLTFGISITKTAIRALTKSILADLDHGRLITRMIG